MLHDLVEKIRIDLYNELNNISDKFLKHCHSLLVAFFVSNNREKAEKVANFNSEDIEKLTEKIKELDKSIQQHDKCKKMILETIVNFPNAISKALKYTSVELEQYLLNAESPEPRANELNINSGLTKLILKLLNITDNNSIANFSASAGVFESIGCKMYPTANFFAFEKNELNNIIAHVRGIHLKKFFNIQKTDLFSVCNDGRKFDRVFTFAPLGLGLKSISFLPYVTNILNKKPNYKKSNLAEWFYALRITDMIHANGIAIGLFSSGATWNTLDKEIRMDLVKKGLIKAVISLPDKLIKGINCDTTLIIFSNNNKTVNMINATNIYTKCRRQNILSDEDIDVILNSVNNESIYNHFATLEEIRDEEFNINPIRYTNTSNLQNLVPLKSLLIDEITRGKGITAKQFDSLSTSAANNFQFLTLSSIKDGFIDNNLPNIYSPNIRNEKFIVKKNDILITKSGNPIKVAVSGDCEDKKIIASDNIFIVRLDQSKILPYYLKAFFESEEGYKQIKKALSGTTTQVITKAQLENIQVPLIPIEDQVEIANKYKYLEDEIIEAKSRLENLQNKIKAVWR